MRFSDDDYARAAEALRKQSEREGRSDALLELASRFELATKSRTEARADGPPHFAGHRVGRIVLWLTVGALVLSAILAIGALLGGDFGEGEGRILLAVLTVWVFSLVFLVGVHAAASDRTSWRLSGLATQILAAVSAVLSLVLIGVWDGVDEATLRGYLSVVILTGSSAQSAYLLGWNRDEEALRLAVVATLAVLVLLTAFLLALTVGAVEAAGSGYIQAIGVFAVLLALGDLLLPVLHRLRGAARN